MARAARAHPADRLLRMVGRHPAPRLLAALERAAGLGFRLFVTAAPTPFDRADAAELKADAASVIARHFPEAPALWLRAAGAGH